MLLRVLNTVAMVMMLTMSMAAAPLTAYCTMTMTRMSMTTHRIRAASTARMPLTQTGIQRCALAGLEAGRRKGCAQLVLVQPLADENDGWSKGGGNSGL